MENCYVLRMPSEALMCFYFDEEKRVIVYKSYENNRWGRASVLIEDTRRQFTVSLDRKGAVYLFCQNKTGDIVLCSNSTGEWERKVILENKANKIYTIIMHAVLADGGLQLIYNMPDPRDKTNFLMAQTFSEKGRWSAAERVDQFSAGKDRMYTVTDVSAGHALLFYQTRTPENNLGYREITASARGAYNVVHSTGYQIADTSFVTTDDAVHMLYVVKSLFSCQLVYRCKRSERVGAALVVWEAQSIDNCLLFFVKGSMYATFLSNGQLHCCVSEDGGTAFGKAFRYQNKFCLQPVKATYVSHPAQSESAYRCSQLYVDAASLWDVQLLPDLYEDFYPHASPTPGRDAAHRNESAPARREPTQYAPIEFAEIDFAANEFAAMEQAPPEYVPPNPSPPERALPNHAREERPPRYPTRDAEASKTGEKLFLAENRLRLAEKHNQEKDERLIEMNERLKRKNADIAELERNGKRLAERIEALEEKLAGMAEEKTTRLPEEEPALKAENETALTVTEKTALRETPAAETEPEPEPDAPAEAVEEKKEND